MEVPSIQKRILGIQTKRVLEQHYLKFQLTFSTLISSSLLYFSVALITNWYTMFLLLVFLNLKLHAFPTKM